MLLPIDRRSKKIIQVQNLSTIVKKRICKHLEVLANKLVRIFSNTIETFTMAPKEAQKIKDFFQREEQTAESAIRSNAVENNGEMVKHWQQWKSGVQRIKMSLFNELNIK